MRNRAVALQEAMMRSVLMGMVLVAAVGCAARSQWYKPSGAADGEFAIAQARCEARAYRVFPRAPETVQTSSGWAGVAQTQCGRAGAGFQCTSRQANYSPPEYETVDTAAAPRRRQYEACLIEAGWRKVPR